MTDVTMPLTLAEAEAFLARLTALRPIYEETQLTGYDPLTTPHAVTVVGNEFRKRSADGLTNDRWTPRGISLASIVWTDPMEALDALELEPCFSDIDVIRVPIHVSHWQSTDYTKQEFIDDYIDPVIQRIIGYGKYAVLDCHPVANYTSETMAWVFEFWEYLAPFYRNEPRVIYEIFNEPIGNGLGGGQDQTLETWLAFKLILQPLIDYIRKKAPSNHIIAGSPNWATRIRHAGTHPFVDDNLSYTFHAYPNYAANYGAQVQHYFELDNPYDLVPIFQTEFGWDSLSVDSDVVNLWRNTYFPEAIKRVFLDHPNVGYIVWNWDTDSRPPMREPEGADSLAKFTDWVSVPVDYAPLDTPLTLADYLDVPDLFIAWDGLRSTITEVSSKISEVSALAGSLTLTQTDAAKRPVIDAAGINGEDSIYFAGGYNGNHLNVSSADTLLNGKSLLTFVALVKPLSGNAGNAPIFTFSDGTTYVTLTAKTDGMIELLVSGGGTGKYLTSNVAVNDTEVLILITVDFATSICSLEYAGYELSVNSGFGTTAFTGSTVGTIGGSAGGSNAYKGHIGFVAVIDGIYEHRYKKALINYITANR